MRINVVDVMPSAEPHQKKNHSVPLLHKYGAEPVVYLEPASLGSFQWLLEYLPGQALQKLLERQVWSLQEVLRRIAGHERTLQTSLIPTPL